MLLKIKPSEDLFSLQVAIFDSNWYTALLQKINYIKIYASNLHINRSPIFLINDFKSA